MTEKDLLEALYQGMKDLKSDMQDMKDDIQGIKTEMQDMKDDIQGIKTEMQDMKDDIQGIKTEMQDMHQKVTSIELNLENETNRNIQLLAENHIDLVNKLNQAIHVQDKSLLYEVQVSGLKMKIENLEREVAALKEKIA